MFLRNQVPRKYIKGENYKGHEQTSVAPNIEVTIFGGDGSPRGSNGGISLTTVD